MTGRGEWRPGPIAGGGDSQPGSGSRRVPSDLPFHCQQLNYPYEAVLGRGRSVSRRGELLKEKGVVFCNGATAAIAGSCAPGYAGRVDLQARRKGEGLLAGVECGEQPTLNLPLILASSILFLLRNPDVHLVWRATAANG